MKHMVTIHNPEQNRIAEVHTSSVQAWARRGFTPIDGSIRGEALAPAEDGDDEGDSEGDDAGDGDPAGAVMGPSDETPPGESETDADSDDKDPSDAT
jgi:hypothetical protein